MQEPWSPLRSRELDNTFGRSNPPVVVAFAQTLSVEVDGKFTDRSELHNEFPTPIF